MFLVYVVFTDRNDHNWILKILWTYLHLRSLHRIVVIFPVVPHHSLNIVLAVKIQTIQVGRVATVVPPGALKLHGTVSTSAAVTVTIFGGKWISSVMSKGISSGTLKKTIRQQQILVSLFFIWWTRSLPFCRGSRVPCRAICFFC